MIEIERKEAYILKHRLLHKHFREEPKTLEEVGKELGVTRERIRQIESKIIEAIEKSLKLE